MNNAGQIRQVCADAMRQAAQAEQRATQARDAAARQRQSASDSARRHRDQARQQAQSLYNEILTQIQQGDKALGDLKLSPSIPAMPTFQAYGYGPDDLLRLLQNQASQTRETLARLNTTAVALKAERRRWWKFW